MWRRGRLPYACVNNNTQFLLFIFFHDNFFSFPLSMVNEYVTKLRDSGGHFLYSFVVIFTVKVASRPRQDSMGIRTIVHDDLICILYSSTEIFIR